MEYTTVVLIILIVLLVGSVIGLVVVPPYLDRINGKDGRVGLGPF